MGVKWSLTFDLAFDIIGVYFYKNIQNWIFITYFKNLIFLLKKPQVNVVNRLYSQYLESGILKIKYFAHDHFLELSYNSLTLKNDSYNQFWYQNHYAYIKLL